MDKLTPPQNIWLDPKKSKPKLCSKCGQDIISGYNRDARRWLYLNLSDWKSHGRSCGKEQRRTVAAIEREVTEAANRWEGY